MNRFIGFAVSIVLSGIILHLVKFDETKVALQQVEVLLRQDLSVRDIVAQRCSKIIARDEIGVDKFFLARLIPGNTGGSACILFVEASQSHRFFLVSHRNFLLRVLTESGASLLERNFLVDVPQPLCFLPIAIFLLSLIFEMRFWSLGLTLAIYLLLLGGLNAIRSADLAFRSAWLTLQTEQNFLGYLLLVFWLSLYRSQGRPSPAPLLEKSLWQGLFNRLGTVVIGLWNPALYTLGARLFFPLRAGFPRLVSFLDSQFLVICLSAYLLSIDGKSLREVIDKSVLLPRYFSFTALLFFAIAYWSSRPKRQVVMWQFPRFWRLVLGVATIEICALRIPQLKDMPTLLRVAIGATASELVWPTHIRWREVTRLFFPSAIALFTSAFLVILSQEAGIRELVLNLFDPRLHPSAVVLFTFVSGLALGFFTGNFSAAFFSIFAVMGRGGEAPLVRAAMLDGIMAGTLLSPFSLFNLFPAAQFKISIHELVAFRFRQLAIPLAIGGTIFAVSSINSVAILQPVTFVFLCLVALAFQLNKRAWRFRKQVPVSMQA